MVTVEVDRDCDEIHCQCDVEPDIARNGVRHDRLLSVQRRRALFCRSDRIFYARARSGHSLASVVHCAVRERVR
jgi:hypothetical protein